MKAMKQLIKYIETYCVNELEKIQIGRESETGIDAGSYVCLYIDENSDVAMLDFENRIELLSIDQIFDDNRNEIYIGKSCRDIYISGLQKDSTKFDEISADYRLKYSRRMHFTHGKICFNFFIMGGTSDRVAVFVEDTLIRAFKKKDEDKGVIQCLNEKRSAYLKNPDNDLVEDNELVTLIKDSLLEQLKYANVEVTLKIRHNFITHNIDDYFFEKNQLLSNIPLVDGYMKKPIDRATLDDIQYQNENNYLMELVKIDAECDLFQMAVLQPLQGWSFEKFYELIGIVMDAPIQGEIIKQNYKNLYQYNVPITKFIPINYNRSKLTRAIQNFMRNPSKSPDYNILVAQKLTYLSMVALLLVDSPFFVRFSLKTTKSIDKLVDGLYMYEDGRLSQLAEIKRSKRESIAVERNAMSSASCIGCKLLIQYMSHGVSLFDGLNYYGLATIAHSKVNSSNLPGHEINCVFAALFNKQISIASYNEIHRFPTFDEFKLIFTQKKEPEYERYPDPAQNDYDRYYMYKALSPSSIANRLLQPTIAIDDASNSHTSNNSNSINKSPTLSSAGSELSLIVYDSYEENHIGSNIDPELLDNINNYYDPAQVHFDEFLLKELTANKTTETMVNIDDGTAEKENSNIFQTIGSSSDAIDGWPNRKRKYPWSDSYSNPKRIRI